ncbi:MAG: hypothetical protein R3D43_11730 [Tepidamorphaceae bacterium]
MREDERHPFSLAAIFWIAGAAGILVKGPIWLMVVGLTAAARSLAARSVSWLAPLRPVAGAAFLLAAVLPWLIAIMVISDGAFLRQSVGHDMLGKVASAQESHGAPPGTYLGAFLITAWPMIAPMLLALGWIWRNRSLSAVMFLICWIVPAWIVFELVPTKLPHYVLPLYPGIAILAALALEKGGLLTGRFWTRLLLASGGAVLVYAPLIAFALYAWFEGRVPAAGIVFWLLLLPAGVLAVREGWRENAARALIVTALAAPLFYLSIYEGALSRVTSVRLAERVADAIGQSVSCKHPTVMSAGYNEASLLFELGTGTAFGTPDEAAAFLGQPGCRVALVTDAKREAFLLGIGKIGVDVIERAKVEGLNLGNARPVSVHVYEIRS